MKKYQRGNIGENHELSDGSIAIIIDGGSKTNYCTISYNKGQNKKEVHIKNLRLRKVKNELAPRVYNAGCVGIGPYQVRDNKGKLLTSYNIWSGMLERCYRGETQERYPTYKNVIVCDKWLNYQNFCKWFYKKYKTFKGSNTHLDKDILSENELIYSPKTCCFIPEQLNTFMCNNKSTNTSGYTGVDFQKNNKKYRARISDFINGKTKHIGYYETALEAGKAYIKEREIMVEAMKQRCINEWGITDKRILNNIQ